MLLPIIVIFFSKTIGTDNQNLSSKKKKKTIFKKIDTSIFRLDTFHKFSKSNLKIRNLFVCSDNIMRACIKTCKNYYQTLLIHTSIIQR